MQRYYYFPSQPNNQATFSSFLAHHSHSSHHSHCSHSFHKRKKPPRFLSKASRKKGKLYDAMFESKADHFYGGGNAKFVEDIRLVTIDRTEGDVELVSNLLAK